MPHQPLLLSTSPRKLAASHCALPPWAQFDTVDFQSEVNSLCSYMWKPRNHQDKPSRILIRPIEGILRPAIYRLHPPTTTLLPPPSDALSRKRGSSQLPLHDDGSGTNVPAPDNLMQRGKPLRRHFCLQSSLDVDRICIGTYDAVASDSEMTITQQP